MSYDPNSHPTHSSGWVAQVWIAFGTSVAAGAIGIYFLPVDPWIRGFVGMAFIMAVTSSISLAKTLRDLHEADRLVNKIDEAKLQRFLAENPVDL